MLLFLLLAAIAPARASEIIWTDDDWSGSHYTGVSNVDPNIQPGFLFLTNQLDDIRFLSSPTAFQGLYSMVVYRDTLFLTASDYPYTYDGAAVIAYDYLTNTSAVVYEPYESGLHLIKRYGDTLYVPGPDSMDPWYTPGSIYTYDGNQWVEKATLAEAVHVNDVDIVNGVIYATTGQRNRHGYVLRSTDWGNTFTPVLDLPYNMEAPIRRFFGLGHHGNRLFVQPDGYAPESNVIYSTVDGAEWDTIPLPIVPVDYQATFTTYGDSLLMTINTRMYIYNGVSWLGPYMMPFHQYRWDRAIHEFKGDLYGGGVECEIHRWLGGANWEYVASMGVDPATEEIEAMATCYGRLYVSTSRREQGQEARLYVAAAAPLGTLTSLAHDFGTPVWGGVLSWDAYRPQVDSEVRFRIRSGPSLIQMQYRQFVGPDGTSSTYYVDSGTPLHESHEGDRYFQYRLEMSCSDGMWPPLVRSVTLTADTVDPATVELEDEEGAESGRGLAVRFASIRPNPTWSAVELSVSVAAGALPGNAPSRIPLRILDVQGRSVRTADAGVGGDGLAHWRWDLTDDQGRPVPAGMYQARIEVPGASSTRPVVVLR